MARRFGVKRRRQLRTRGVRRNFAGHAPQAADFHLQGRSVCGDANSRRRFPTPIRRREATTRHKLATGVASYNPKNAFSTGSQTESLATREKKPGDNRDSSTLAPVAARPSRVAFARCDPAAGWVNSPLKTTAFLTAHRTAKSSSENSRELTAPGGSWRNGTHSGSRWLPAIVPLCDITTSFPRGVP